jgi:hypothetical protein
MVKRDIEMIIQRFNDLEVQNLDKLKDVFATKEDLYKVKEDIVEKMNSKIDKIYWFLIGQTAVLVMLVLAILRLVDIV